MERGSALQGTAAAAGALDYCEGEGRGENLCCGRNLPHWSLPAVFGNGVYDIHRCGEY